MSYTLLSWLSALLRLIPLAWVCAIGRFIGRAVYALDRPHARLALAHLRLAFPEKSSEERQQIAKQLFINLGESALEFLTYRHASMEYCLAHVETVNEDICHRVLARGKGMIYLTAHFGNWEVLGILGYAIMRAHKICAVGRESSDKSFNAYVKELREVSGLSVIPKDGAVRTIMRALRKGEVATFLADQIAGSDGVEVSFLGRPTWATSTPATLSIATGAPIVPAFFERVKAGHHRLTYCEPIEPTRIGDVASDVQRMTQQGMTELEKFVLRRPDHWFWLHKRWKSKKAKKRFQDSYRIVVFSPHWIGDAVLSLPAQAALKKLFPNATLAVAYPSGLEDLYKGIPLYDERIAYAWTPSKFSMRARWDWIQKLRGDPYDLAVLLPNSFDSGLIALAAGIRHRIGYAAHARRILLSDAVEMSKGPLHQAEKYRAIVEAIGVISAEGMPRFDVAAADAQWARDFLGSDSAKMRVALHPGAMYGPTKRWFPERFVALAEELAKSTRVEVIFLGSEKEKIALEPYLHEKTFARRDAMGKSSLGQLIALLSGVNLVVCNDSGPMHLAGLVGTPSVAIFGSTDPFATSPLGPHRIVREPIACSPCLSRSCANNAHPFECLDKISVDQVLKIVKSVLTP